MPVDLATLSLELDTTGMARGARQVDTILTGIERRFEQTLRRVQQINKAINSAFNLGGGSSGGQARTATAGLNAELEKTAVRQKRAADEALKHAQALARLQQVQGNTSGAIKTINTALTGFTGSVRQSIGAQTQLARLQASQSWTRYASTVREAGESIQQTGSFLVGLSASLLSVGAAAVKSAFDIDKNINVLRALLGSSEAAETRFKELVAISQRTPGLTAAIAGQIDAQLRVANATEQAINKVLPAIGKLNAVSNIQDPQRFVQNLVQLVTQNFERIDLKELIGQSPLAGELIKQIFNVDNAINGEAIRASAQKLGLTTVDAFFTAFGEAAAKNTKLANVGESLSTQFAKLVDRVTIALRPLGLSIVETLTPLVERGVAILEKLGKAFTALPQSARTAIVVLGAFAIAIGPVVIALGALIQAIGAFGNLAVVFAGLGGLGAGFTTAAAAAAPLIGVIGLITAALGLGVVAWNKYGASANDAANSTALAGDVMSDLGGLANGLVNDLLAIDNAIKGAFDFGVLTSFDDLLKGTAADIAIIKDLFELLAVSAVGSLKKIAFTLTNVLDSALSIFGIKLQSLKGELERLGGDIQQLDARFSAGFSNLRAVESRIARDTPEQRALDAAVAADLAIESDLIRRSNLPSTPKPKPAPRPGSGGGSSRSRIESEARQIRAAEEELAKAKAAALETIQSRSLQSQLEAEKENFEKRKIGADAFFEARKKIEIELLALTERRIKAEAAASTRRLLAAKDGSPEALRELAQLVGLQSQLRVVEVERTDKIRELNAELEKNLKLERDRRAENLKTVAGSVGEGLLKVGEQIQGIQRAQLERPSVELRKEELRLQGLANAGLIRESELQDALTLARRAARSELIRSLEVERESLAKSQDAGRFSAIQQIEEQIIALQSLGSELTRAEALQRRFAEQGILDYSRMNEGLEELLASQKGLTEIFSDFRANTVADGFGLIETGVDKLTERLGILGDAFGQLLKDLAKLAVSKLLQKLLGLDGGQSSSPGFGGAGAARSTSPLSALGSLITGGGGASGGGGFLTGGFAGGNPAQAILGGRQGSGGGSPLGGLLQKIPGLGKLFGSGGGSLVGGIGPNIGSLPGGIQGVSLPPLTAPGGGAAGAGALGSVGGLAAGGLIAGGGVLGSLLGGRSQIGQLLGGVGGSLVGGFAASSLLNPALLPAFFSNPITAIIGGALLGGAALFRFFSGREQRRFSKTVEDEYALKVDGKEKGTEVYKAIKGLGEEKFGKGKFGKNMAETIRLSKAQEALAAYGEATGQENNPLVRKFRDRKELTNPFDPRNEFIKRAHGGGVNANQPYIVGDGGRSEVFVPTTAGQVYPSIAEFMREIVRPQTPQTAPVGGGWTGEARETLRAMMAVNVRLVEALNRFESLPPEEVVRVAARRDPDTFAGANLTSIRNNSAAGKGQLQEFRKGR